MTKPTVTDEMVDAAEAAYEDHMDAENYCDRGALRAAIQAALEAMNHDQV